MKNVDQYTFFWLGPFSQLYRCSFKVDDIQYNCIKQFMEHSKALMFEDYSIATQIMATSNPLVQKQLGRRVKNFDKAMWNTAAKSIMYIGNRSKFTHSPVLLEALFATGNSLLVEASPYNSVWSIGLTENTARCTPTELWGTNWLGEVLTLVRDDIRNDVI